MKNLVLDLGNTALKAAIFVDGEPSDLHAFQTLNELLEFVNSVEFDNAILSSVLNDGETNYFKSEFNKDLIEFSFQSDLPVKIGYKTPETLGKDRLANACFASVQNKYGNSLIIDTGTCIKFDFVNDKNVYEGGSIGPGLEMRFKALNNYTGKLPLINFEENFHSLVGSDTNNSILSGVITGMTAEINGMIQNYESRFPDLTIFITGGDMDKFDIKAKNTIFADRFITLKGLNEVLSITK